MKKYLAQLRAGCGPVVLLIIIAAGVAIKCL